MNSSEGRRTLVHFFYRNEQGEQLSFENDDVPHLFPGMIVFHKQEKRTGLPLDYLIDVLKVVRIDFVSIQPDKVTDSTRSRYEVHCELFDILKDDRATG